MPSAARDLFDNRDPLYAGEAGLGMDPKLAQRIRDADVVLCIGARLGETTTQGYALFDVPRPRQRLVHVHADPEELGHVYRADVAINASMDGFARGARSAVAGHDAPLERLDPGGAGGLRGARRAAPSRDR